jgi:hypothetical protein
MPIRADTHLLCGDLRPFRRKGVVLGLHFPGRNAVALDVEKIVGPYRGDLASELLMGTIAHELAHVAAYNAGGPRRLAHDRLFLRFAVLFGREFKFSHIPSTCHECARWPRRPMWF